MMIRRIWPFFPFLLLVVDCASVRYSPIETGADLQETAIRIAIADFSNTCRLFKKDSVFCVDYNDSVFEKATLVVGTFNDGHTLQWKRGDLLDGMACVEIGAASYYQHYYSEDPEDANSHLPTKYVIVRGKLFYWRDEKHEVTEDIIGVLWRYNVLQSESIIPDFFEDENAKGAHYFFCKKNLSKYKRVVTNKALGYYSPPRVTCN